ncbi:MAG: serine/threonine protein kinase [Acidobacteria bacterium]|nr:serine/threonine protein kinase [Acidobacteriota bacterium]
MTWLSDNAVSRLRAIAEEPDFRGTRYTIVRELARGGMGIVYEAEDAELQRRVAIKVVATELASEDAAERMRREARVIAKLEHPGIVPLHDVGALPDGRIFYAMKLVRGHRLDERPLARTEALRLFLRLCEAVAFAHANGVVHCDLKPSNVMVGAFGELLVMDWGVARVIGEASPSLVAGTHGFMAPEQERGDVVDASADVFALGAILRELLPDAPKPLRALVEKCLAPNANERFPDASHLAAEIARYLDGEPLLTYRESLIERTARWLTQNRALVAVVVAYIVMRLIVLFFIHR